MIQRPASRIVLLCLGGLGACAGSLATPAGFQLGVQVSRYRYREPAARIQLSGVQWGLNAAYTLAAAGGGFWGAAGAQYDTGRLRYQGSGTLDGVPDAKADLRLTGGYDFFPTTGLALSPYLGFGYRALWNDLRGVTSAGSRGYRRDSTYQYLPVGCTVRFPLGAGWVAAPALEYDFLLKGIQTSRLADAGPPYADAVNHQAGGSGCRLDLMLERRRLWFGPWLETWDLASSDLVSAGPDLLAQEPRNHTLEAGLSLGWRF